MKIDLEMLERMVAAGATGAIILGMIRLEHERYEVARAAKRPGEKVRKQRTRAGHKRTKADMGGTATESERLEATVTDTPRARLFREGKGALLTMRISENRAGGLIAQWLKLVGDDEQLVLAAILQAQKLGAADAPGYIMEVLKGKTDGNGTRDNRANSVAGRATAREAHDVATMGGAALRYLQEGKATGAGRDTPGGASPAGEFDLGKRAENAR